MNKQDVQLDLRDTYLATIKNSVGSTMFRNLYAKVNGETVDVMRDGDLSCAFFVSSILALSKLCTSAHATVDTTLLDMKKSGWIDIDEPRVGCVIVWENKHFEESNEAHQHIGFYIGDDKAVSNSDKARAIAEHPYQSHNGRGISHLLWHPQLDA